MALEDLEADTLQDLAKLLRSLMEDKPMRRPYIRLALGVSSPILDLITTWDDPYFSFIVDMAEKLAFYNLPSGKSALREFLEYISVKRLVGEEARLNINMILEMVNESQLKKPACKEGREL